MYTVEISYCFAGHEIVDGGQETICEDPVVKSKKEYKTYEEAKDFMESYEPIRKPYEEIERMINKDGRLIIKSFDGMYSILHGRIVYWFTKDYYLRIKSGS